MIIHMKIGRNMVYGLVDTGAQPTVIKKSCVPIGTPIKDGNMSIKGVNGPHIKVSGKAEIPLEIGFKLFIQECIVVEDQLIDFPEDCGIILGNNFFAHNIVDISISKWALLHSNQVLTHLTPSWIDGKFFSVREVKLDDDLKDSDTDSASEVEGEPIIPDHGSCCSSEEASVRRVNTPFKTETKTVKKQRIYPGECMLRNGQEEMCWNEGTRTGRGQPHLEQYNVMPQANITLKAAQVCWVEVLISDATGIAASENFSYEINGGLLAPGVILLQGISNQRDKIQVINYNNDSLNLYKNIPVGTATKFNEENLCQFQNENMNTDITHPDVYTLMALSSITEEAYVTPQEFASDTEELEEALNYDPSEIPSKEVIYDEVRFQSLLNMLNSKSWKLSKRQRLKAEEVLRKNQKAFNLPGELLPCTPLIKHDIKLHDPEKIIFVKPRWTPIHQRAPVEKEMKGLIEHTLATPTTSPHSSPVVLVRKKEPGKYRMAVDYRKLNSATIPMYFPVTHIEEVLFKIALSKIHSRYDLKMGFMQVAMYRKAQKYTAFSCHMGHWQYNRMPFGLANAPFTLNMLMNKVFGHLSDFVSTFFDDIFTHSNSIEDHIIHVDKTLSALIQANLQVSPEKTCMFTQEVDVLGHIAGGGTLRPALDKIGAITDFPVPKTKTNIRAFLGMCGFYRRFVKGFAFIAKPLTEMTKESVKFNWGMDQQAAFDELKSTMTQEPILKAPDFSRVWYVITDACDIGIAGWLGQRYDGKIHAVAYFSRQLRKPELSLKRDAMELETLAILESLQKFRPLIWGQRIVILSDNNALMWLFNKSTYKSARLTRWAMSVQGFNATLLHLPGTLNRVADALSRNPICIDEDTENKAVSILDHCDQVNVSLIGCFEKIKPPPHKEVLLKINSLRNNEKEVEETGREQAWTIEEMKAKQSSDTLLKPIIEYLRQPTHIAKMKVDPNIKNLEDYFLDPSGILFIRISDKAAELREGEEVVVIPFSLQKTAAALMHDSFLGGHAALERTLFAAKRKFFWRGMKQTIEKYISNCHLCKLHKGRPHPKPPLRKYPLPEKPFDTISMDLIGPLKLTSQGNRYILVVTDFLTRYVSVKPLPDKTANAVAESLCQIFCEHGAPRIMYSDSGAEFRNAVLTEMAKNFRIKHILLAVYHPASNGLVERKNQSIIQVLKCFMDLEDWDKVLYTTQLAVNAAYCRTLGDSPFFVLKGKDPDLPYTRFARPAHTYAEVLTYEQERQRREHYVLEKVKEKLLEEADKSARSIQKKCKDKSLQIDDRVFIKRKQKKNEGKLSPKWKGPYRVMSRKTPNQYKLKDLYTGKITDQHIENISKNITVARESEIPLAECPTARLPFPQPEEEEIGRQPKEIPEGAPDDNWIDDSYWLRSRSKKTQPDKNRIANSV